MLGLTSLDLDEITIALADQTAYERCWLIIPARSEIRVLDVRRRIGGRMSVDLDPTRQAAYWRFTPIRVEQNWSRPCV